MFNSDNPKVKSVTFKGNNCLRDTRLSWGAKGFYLFLLSQSPAEKKYVLHPEAFSKDGRDSTNTKIKELIDTKYIIRKLIKGSNGQFQGYEYTII